ncbi:MAG TPA: MBL fold metallo-hydrolase [Bryobacteraceae bacterium]|nr:MBL fold metallo-hydrolase [Bryobacteraceae bacterium]
MTRREFVCLLASPASAQLTRSAEVVPGAVNGLIFTRGGRRLAVYGDPRPSPASAEQVLLTHSRRDVVWAARELQRKGATVIAPATEAELIAHPGKFWQSFEKARYHDYAMLNSRVLTEPLPVARAVRGGERIEWQGLVIDVLDTPGYSPGAVSYLVTVDDRRIACTGDLIYGDGQLFDLWSLQDAVPEAKLRGYHGYAARAGELIRSLRAVAGQKPDVLVPARGPVIERPTEAIDNLITRLKTPLREHFTTDALRWYFKDDNLRLRAAKLLEGEVPEWMPMAETRALPGWAVTISNSRLLLSESGAAFLVDCGSDDIVAKVAELRDSGRFRTLAGVFITHYHDDHTDRAQVCAERFGCPVYFTSELRDILENPSAYRAPCLTTFPIRSGKALAHGHRWRWHEFELSVSFFPGQTLWHDSLLAKKDGGEAILFVGDSFTPSGIDDYCLWNRDFLSPGEGFWNCMEQVRRLPRDTWLVNQHVEPAFRFTEEQLNYMQRSLQRRAAAMQPLFPWPGIDFGLDEQWCRLAPYEVKAAPGRPFQLQAFVWNHAPTVQEFTVRLNLPAGWKASEPAYRIRTQAGGSASAAMTITPTPEANGLAVITADVEFSSYRLREWTEAMVRL